MTTDKAFKRVVRARMAKTGERYAAARRTLLDGTADGRHAEPTADTATPTGYRMRGGLHPETAALANVLANQGVVSGLTGEPLTEAALLGIARPVAAHLLGVKSHGGPSWSRDPESCNPVGLEAERSIARQSTRPPRDRGAKGLARARCTPGRRVPSSPRRLQSVGTWDNPRRCGHYGCRRRLRT